MAKNISSFTDKIDIIGKKHKLLIQDIISNKPVLVVIGSHSSLIIVKEIPPIWIKKNIPLQPDQFISVAAVSKAPWPIKKLFIPNKLEDLKEERDNKLKKILPNIYDSPVIADYDGKVVKFFDLEDLGKTGFAAFVILKNGNVQKVYKGNIKETDSNESKLNAEIRKEAEAIVDSASIYFKK